MREILTVILIAAVLAIPAVVTAKPFGYMGPGRAVDSHLDHAQRKSRAKATFHQTVTNPAPIAKAAKTAKTANPSQPTPPKSTVGFHVTP